MTPEQVLAQPARILSQKQRESYFAKGYLLVENAVPSEWIQRLRSVTVEMVERSRERKKSDAMFDLEPGHTAEKPRLRRLSSPVEHHPVYWDFVVQSPIADISESTWDLLLLSVPRADNPSPLTAGHGPL